MLTNRYFFVGFVCELNCFIFRRHTLYLNWAHVIARRDWLCWGTEAWWNFLPSLSDANWFKSDRVARFSSKRCVYCRKYTLVRIRRTTSRAGQSRIQVTNGRTGLQIFANERAERFQETFTGFAYGRRIKGCSEDWYHAKNLLLDHTMSTQPVEN